MARPGVRGILEELGKLLVVLEHLLESEEVSIDSLTVRSFGSVLEMTGDGLSEELDPFGVLVYEKDRKTSQLERERKKEKGEGNETRLTFSPSRSMLSIQSLAS